MKKVVKRDTLATKKKAVSKGSLEEIANIKKNTSLALPEKQKVSLSKKYNKVEQTETTKTKSSKILMRSGNDKTTINAKEKKEKNKDYVMIEKTVTVRQTKTTFLDDDEEDELFNDDWFGGSKLKKQKQVEEGIEEEDLDTIIESFGKDDDKYW